MCVKSRIECSALEECRFSYYTTNRSSVVISFWTMLK